MKLLFVAIHSLFFFLFLGVYVMNFVENVLYIYVMGLVGKFGILII